MEPSREVIRNLLLYKFELGHDAQTACNKINRAMGYQVVGRSTAFDWFQKFREDNTHLNDQSRSGRPREVDREAVIEAIELDSTLTAGGLGIWLRSSVVERQSSGRF